MKKPITAAKNELVEFISVKRYTGIYSTETTDAQIVMSPKTLRMARSLTYCLELTSEKALFFENLITT